MGLPIIYTPEQAARALGITRPAVIRLSRKHPHLFKKLGRDIRIAETDLARLWDASAKEQMLSAPKEEKPRFVAPNERAPVVYVLGFGPYVKIGMTGFLKDRLEKIQTHAPEQIEVYATFGGGRDLELSLHERFADLRLRGEWFRRALRLEQWIKDGCSL